MEKKISWIAPEHIFTEKTADWYWIVGIVFSTTIIISIILGNIIFAILIFISLVFIFLNAHKAPENIEITINSKGIKKGNKIYFYNELHSFWVEDQNMYPRILFKSKNILSPFIIILIHEDDADEIRELLNQFLEEEYMTENILSKIFIYFGF